VSFVSEFNKLVGNTRRAGFQTEAADKVQHAFDAMVRRNLDADLKMNKRDAYVPAKGVLRQRELSRQFDEIIEVGQKVRDDFWAEASGSSKVQVGFRDNRPSGDKKPPHHVAVQKLESAIKAAGFGFEKVGAVQHVFRDLKLADEVEKRLPEYLKLMAEKGANVLDRD
jgi:hypothetical protein